jgi:hypothetical protein
MERWLLRELERPRIAGAAGQRDNLHEWLAQAQARTGRLSDARASVAAGSNSWLPLAEAQIAFRSDGPAGVTSSLRAMRDEGRARGSRWTEMALDLELGRAEAVAGSRAGVAALDAAVAVAAGGGAHCFEVAARAERALWAADLGRAGQARDDLERCRAVMGADPGWRSLGALLDVVDGVLAAQDDRRAAAAAWFARAVPVLHEHGLVWDEAEALYRWGAVASRDPSRQADRLDAAAELLRRHGAGPFWLDRVAAAREAVTAP